MQFPPTAARLTVSCAALFFTFCVGERALAQNLVANPGFETGDFTGWTESGGLTAVDMNPHTGTFAADSQENGAFDSLSQNLATVAGQSYDLSFWLASSNLSLGPTQEFKVSWNGTVVLDRTDTAPFSYTQISLPNLLATTNSTPLLFQIRNDPGNYFLDDVSATIVPEPSSLIMIGVGSLLFLAPMRFRQAKN